MSILGLRSSSIGKEHHVRIGIACDRMVRPGRLGDSPLFIVNIIFHVSPTCGRSLYGYKRCIRATFYRLTRSRGSSLIGFLTQGSSFFGSTCVSIVRLSKSFSLQLVFPAFCPLFGFHTPLVLCLCYFKAVPILDKFFKSFTTNAPRSLYSLLKEVKVFLRLP